MSIVSDLSVKQVEDIVRVEAKKHIDFCKYRNISVDVMPLPHRYMIKLCLLRRSGSVRRVNITVWLDDKIETITNIVKPMIEWLTHVY